MAQDALEYRRVIGAPIGEAFRARSPAPRPARTGCATWPWPTHGRKAGSTCRNRGYYTAGVFTAVETDQHVAFTAGRMSPRPRIVEVWLQPLAGATEVRPIHRGLGEGEAGNAQAA